MASDAYMELETRHIIGETFDTKFGMSGPDARRQGAFEISSCTFSADSNRETEPDKGKTPVQTPGTPPSRSRPAAPAAPGNPATPKLKETTINGVTIKKPIDASSADLFMLCCDHKVIKWGIITLREAGDFSKKPWLIIEFSDMYVDSFDWDIDPDASGDAPKTAETVKFTFATIVIKYNPQDQSGGHSRISMKGWNLKDHKAWEGEPDLKSETW